MAIGICTAAMAISMEVPKNLKVDQLSTLGCSQKDSKSAHMEAPACLCLLLHESQEPGSIVILGLHPQMNG